MKGSSGGSWGIRRLSPGADGTGDPLGVALAAVLTLDLDHEVTAGGAACFPSAGLQPYQAWAADTPAAPETSSLRGPLIHPATGGRLRVRAAVPLDDDSKG
jgi:hypothetical protein